MKYEVINLRCHIGVQLDQKVLNAIDKVKHKVEMEPHVSGVLIHTKDKVILVPYGNIQQADMKALPEEKKGKQS